MSVTNRLLKLDGILREHNEGEWGGGDENKYSAFNDAGLECETGEFMYAMARMLKPEHVLETGTHWGVGASYIGMALLDNGGGHLDTVEFIPEIYDIAKARINRLGLQSYVKCHLGDVAQFTPEATYKLILLDTEPQTRFAELVKFYEYLEPGGFVFIHDLHQHMHQIENSEHGFAWPFGPIPEQIKQWVKDGQLRPFHFETPRGLTGFYKVHPGDYKWR
ncbi:MAG: class I SAM-dependent methyltransferase [Prolixibacteraceae bacterium]|nr:class I SAM-dependent methyltransferase [Prolixibacteraceae bacterium]